MVVQDDRLTTLNLLNLEIIGSLIGIFGLSVFILTSYTSKNILLNSYFNGRHSPQILTLDVAALVGRILLISAGFIAANTAALRLIQLNQKTMRNQPIDGTLEPNIWLTVGSWTAFAGGMISLVGDYKRLQSPRLPIQ